MLRRIGYAVAVGLVALCAFGAGSSLSAEFRAYTGGGDWFPAGWGTSGEYDSFCEFRWVENRFSKSPTAWGVIAFIDTGGGWSYSTQGYSVLSRQVPYDVSTTYTKKPHCRNNTWSGYQGGCYGFVQRPFGQCV